VKNKNLKLGAKIILGFLAVVALVVVAGVTGYAGEDYTAERQQKTPAPMISKSLTAKFIGDK
jgi:CHASE3 domain sensor protein